MRAFRQDRFGRRRVKIAIAKNPTTIALKPTFLACHYGCVEVNNRNYKTSCGANSCTREGIVQ